MDGAADVAETTYRAWLRSLNPNVRRNIICYILTVTITDHSVSGLSRAEASYIVTHLDFWDALYTPFRTEPGAAPVRLIVPRVKPTPGSQLALFATYSYHGFITGRDGEMLELEADHRRHAEIENAIRDLKYGVGLNHLPSGRFAANGSWLAVQVMPYNLARWTPRLGLGERIVTTKTLRQRVFALAGRLPARHAASPYIFPSAGLGRSSSAAPSPGCKRFHSQPDGARPPLTHQPANQTSPPTRATRCERLSPCPYPAISLATATAGCHRHPQKRLQTARQPPVYSNASPDHRACNSLTPLPLSSRRPSVSTGGFGLRAHGYTRFTHRIL